MGTIVNVFSGANGLLRVVAIRMQGKAFKRPMHKLIKLLGEEVKESSIRGEDIYVPEQP